MRRAQDRARSATIESRALGALKLASEARNENVPAKRADFFKLFSLYLYAFHCIIKEYNEVAEFRVFYYKAQVYEKQNHHMCNLRYKNFVLFVYIQFIRYFENYSILFLLL